MKCRHCKTELKNIFLDLGFAPPSNAYLTAEDLQKPESYYPLRLFVCEKCWLVQTDDYTDAAELFDSEYAYFSSISKSWLEHSRRYTEMITEKLNLSSESLVIEIASNDGYLLKNFVENNIPCLGIEPTDSTANTAEKAGVPTLREFFGESLGKQLAAEGKKADLILGNNVYAHVPDINDFTKGMKHALKSTGTITLEFPHLMQLIGLNQFDTVYHEHFSYLSLNTVSKIFESAGLRVYDVEQLPTHGGSLRVYGCHAEDSRKVEDSVANVLNDEKLNGLQDLNVYLNFQKKADKVKNDLLRFLIDKKNEGKKVIAYGAAAKGCTLLNYAGIKPDLLPIVFDAAPSKQGKFLPGTHISIENPSKIEAALPDYVLILPWNIKDEVVKQNESLKEKGVKFVVAVPELEIL